MTDNLPPCSLPAWSASIPNATMYLEAADPYIRRHIQRRVHRSYRLTEHPDSADQSTAARYPSHRVRYAHRFTICTPVPSKSLTF